LPLTIAFKRQSSPCDQGWLSKLAVVVVAHPAVDRKTGKRILHPLKRFLSKECG